MSTRSPNAKGLPGINRTHGTEVSNEQDKTPKRGGIAPFNADGSALSKRLRDALRERYQETLNEPVPDKLQSLIDRIKAAEQKKG